MKKFILIVLGVVVVVIGAALVLPFVLPTETYKLQVVAQVERATGRELTIDGPVEFSLLPSVALHAEDVRFANVPGAAEPDMAKLKALEVELKVWPLLRGEVEVARFVLVEPVIHLEVAANGQPNWQFKPAGGTGEAAQTTGETPSTSGGGGAPTLPVTTVRLGDIRIENGTLTYTDAASGRSERIEAIDLRLELPDLQSPLRAEGSLDYKGETIALDLALDSPMAVIEGGSSPLRLAIDSDPAEVGFEGEVSNGAEPGASGGLDLDVPSIRALAAWLGEPIDFQGEGLEKLTIEGRLEGSAKRVAFTDAKIGLDAITGQGELVADLSAQVPQLSGRLDLGAVDLNPYLPPAAETSEAGQRRATGQEEAAGGAGAGGAPQPSGEEPAVTAANGWSDEPIALPPLGGVGIDFELTLAALQVRALEIGRTVLGLTLRGDTLDAALREFALYDGKGEGTLRVAIEDGGPAISSRFQLEGLQALPFLTAAAGFDRLEGTASAELDLTSRGRSERQLVQNLDGSGKVRFRDGAIVGINIAAMVRNAADAFLNPEAGETRKTDFAELGGSFTIEGGVLRNDDMHLQAPTLRVDGSGRVNLPKRTLNYRLEPKAAATLKGQGGEREVAGLLVPVIIKGPWDDLTYTPDLSDVARRALENPEAIKEQIKQLGDQGDALKDAVKDLDKKEGREALIEGLGKALGGEQKPAEDAGTKEGSAAKEEAKPEEQVQKLLKGLLGN